jgi:cytochrome c oxidase cbb3-type subunit 3
MCSRFLEVACGVVTRRALSNLLLSCFIATSLIACEREARRFSEPASTTVPADSTRLSELQVGGTSAPPALKNAYEENAYAVSQGQRLYSWYNCVGCHAHGGGGSGPALMDDKWIYGHRPENIFATIVQGRPNGMPAFGGKIPEAQVWQLVAYVRSMGGFLRSDVAPGRTDDMKAAEPEARRELEKPKATSTPTPQ